MTTTYGWNEIIFLVLIFGETLLVIGDDGYIFSISYEYLASIFLLLNLAIIEGNTPIILCPRCKEQDESLLESTSVN